MPAESVVQKRRPRKNQHPVKKCIVTKKLVTFKVRSAHQVLPRRRDRDISPKSALIRETRECETHEVEACDTESNATFKHVASEKDTSSVNRTIVTYTSDVDIKPTSDRKLTPPGPAHAGNHVQSAIATTATRSVLSVTPPTVHRMVKPLDSMEELSTQRYNPMLPTRSTNTQNHSTSSMTRTETHQTDFKRRLDNLTFNFSKKTPRIIRTNQADLNLASEFTNLNNLIMDSPKSDTQTTTSLANVPTHNRFGILMSQDTMECDSDNEKSIDPQPKQSASQTKDPTSIQKMPPIVVTHKVDDLQHFHTTIKSIAKNICKIRYLTNSINIQTFSKEDFQNIKAALKSEHVDSFAHSPKDERFKKIVLKAAPFLLTEDIKDTLRANNIDVIDCIPMKSKKTGKQSSSFLVTTNNATNLKKFQDVKAIDHVMVKWEFYSKPKKLSQCFNCQRYGHGSNNCNYKARCVKCAEPHHTSVCQNIKKGEKGNVQCCNCGGPHTANYAGCPHLVSLLEKHSADNPETKKVPKSPTYDSNNFPSLKNRYTPVNNNIKYSQIGNSKSNSNMDDFNVLTNELKELNSICNLKHLIALVRKLKIDLANCTNDFDRINVMQALLESNSCK